jgi:hypothetical protein
MGRHHATPQADRESEKSSSVPGRRMLFGEAAMTWFLSVADGLLHSDRVSRGIKGDIAWPAVKCFCLIAEILHFPNTNEVFMVIGTVPCSPWLSL